MRIFSWSRGDPAAENARATAGSRRLQGNTAPGRTKIVRQQFGLRQRRELIAADLFHGVVGGTRLDNLVCDGLLPLLAVETGRDLFPPWFHWFLGDVPWEVRRGLFTLGLAGTGAGPLCHGWAQGLLGWIIERDARASS